MEMEDNYDFILEIFKKSYELCSPIGNEKGVNPALGKVFEFLLKATLSFNLDLDKSSFELNWSRFKNFIFNKFIHLHQANSFKDDWSRTIVEIEWILKDDDFENYPRGDGFDLFFKKDFPSLLKKAIEEKNEWTRSNIEEDIETETSSFFPKSKNRNILMDDGGSELGYNNPNFLI